MSDFKMRFYLDDFVDSGEYVQLDDIIISDNNVTSHADSRVSFTVNSHSETLIADPGDIHFAQVLSGGVTPDGWYYSCRKDVTNLVDNYSDGAELFASPTVYGDGNGDYTVGNMYSDTKSFMNPGLLADSGYAGWSLVIIYDQSRYQRTSIVPL